MPVKCDRDPAGQAERPRRMNNKSVLAINLLARELLA